MNAPLAPLRRGRCPRSGAKRNKYPWGASPRMPRQRCHSQPVTDVTAVVRSSFLCCHSEPVTDVTGVGIRSPRPQARKPLPPSVREVSTRSVDGGIVKTGGVKPRPYARLPKAHASYVRGDVGIAPYENAKCPCVIRAGGQSRPPLQPSTVPTPCSRPVIPSQ